MAEALFVNNISFTQGMIADTELDRHWQHSREPLFEHTLQYGESTGPHGSITFRLRALTESFADALFAAVKTSWASNGDFESLKQSVNAFHAQRTVGHLAALNPEYYIATDLSDTPFAITGIYTRDMEGQGFALRKTLDVSVHHLNSGLAWFAVAPHMQGMGIGGFLHDWIVALATARGAKRMVIETDDSEGERAAVELYEKRGYRQGFDIPDFFGSGRGRVTYWAYFPSHANGQGPLMPGQPLAPMHAPLLHLLAKRSYSPDRYTEFTAALELFFMQRPGDAVMQMPEGFLETDEAGDILWFAILAKSLYENAVTCYWYGCRDDQDSRSKLVQAMRAFARRWGRDVIIVHREGEDKAMADYGFMHSSGGIPYVYEKRDQTRFLFYSKVLRPLCTPR